MTSRRRRRIAALRLLGLDDVDRRRRRCSVSYDHDENYSVEEIERAYRRAARHHHPDRRGGDDERFVALTAARDHLLRGDGDGDDDDDDDDGTSSVVVVFRGRACVRDAHAVRDGARVVVAAATDDGSRASLVSATTPENDDDGGVPFDAATITVDRRTIAAAAVVAPVMSCLTTFDETGAVVIVTGDWDGRVTRRRLDDDDDDDDGATTAVCRPFDGVDGDDDERPAKVNALCETANDDRRPRRREEGATTPARSPAVVVAAACDDRRAVAVVRFSGNVASVLWRTTLDPFVVRSVEAVVLESRTADGNDDSRLRVRLWAATTRYEDEATLSRWDVDVAVAPDVEDENYEYEDEEWCWDDSDDSDSSVVVARIEPTRTIVLGYGALRDAHGRSSTTSSSVGGRSSLTVAVAVDTDVLLLSSFRDGGEKSSSSSSSRRLSTDRALYRVRLSATRVAACGEGGLVRVWSTTTGTAERDLRPADGFVRTCSLATNCAVALSWATRDEGTAPPLLFSGGYDGRVTMWRWRERDENLEEEIERRTTGLLSSPGKRSEALSS